MMQRWERSLRLYAEGRRTESLELMLAIEAQAAGNGALLANIGVVYRDLGDLARAEDYFRRAMAAMPDDSSARFNLALTLLRAGRLREGFAEYECRWRIPQFQQQHVTLEAPVWNGEPLEGRRILLYGEQGAGDAIQFVRYAPLLRATGADVRLLVRPDLERLFTWLDGDYPVNQSLDCDFQCPMMSLPHRFGTDLDSIPPPANFVVPEPRRFPQDRLNIGVVWAGNPKHPNDRERSVSSEIFAPLTRMPGVRCWSLQVGRSDVPASLEDLSGELTDFAGTAQIICGLDLVITVDTAVAHLAGSLGKPTGLLVAEACDWRWMLNCQDTPWYPSMKILRPPTNPDERRIDLSAFICVHRRP